MLKRDITYEDFNGAIQIEPFYFNLSKPEIVDLEVEFPGGFAAMIQKIIESDDKKAILDQFKRIILLSYGEKSEDGKRFVKTDDIREAFSHTAAFQTLLMELMTEDGAAVNFLKAILPKDLADKFDPNAVTTPPPPK